MCMGLLNGKAASTLHCLRAGSIDGDAAQYNYIFFLYHNYSLGFKVYKGGRVQNRLFLVQNESHFPKECNIQDLSPSLHYIKLRVVRIITNTVILVSSTLSKFFVGN